MTEAAEWRTLNLDDVPVGTWVYQGGVCVGMVVHYRQSNGNSQSKIRRHIQTGRYADRFAYRGDGIYRATKAAGKVQVKA